MATKKGDAPAFNVRAKVGEYWQTVGAAWHVKDGGISIRLNAIPVGDWDGSLLMLPPLPSKEGDADRPAD